MAEAHPARVGRRLAAIVAADVAGYSRLMGLDEVGTARTLRDAPSGFEALAASRAPLAHGLLFSSSSYSFGLCIRSTTRQPGCASSYASLPLSC